MPALRITAARRAGTCPVEYTHDVRIRPGDRTLVTTYFPSDEHVRSFGVAPFARVRVCRECTDQKLHDAARIGTLDHIAGLRGSDLEAAGIDVLLGL